MREIFPRNLPRHAASKLGFNLEAPDEFRPVGQFWQNRLDCDLAPNRQLRGAVDGAKAAGKRANLMGKSARALLQQGIACVATACRDAANITKTHAPNQFQFWFIALAIGIAAGFAAVLFRLGIYAIQTTAYGTDDVLTLHSFAAGLAWYQVLLIPICGGLVVGLILDRFTDDGRVRSVADVIEGATVSGADAGVSASKPCAVDTGGSVAGDATAGATSSSRASRWAVRQFPVLTSHQSRSIAGNW